MLSRRLLGTLGASRTWRHQCQSVVPIVTQYTAWQGRSFHNSGMVGMGFDEFFDQKEKSTDEVHTGRAWTAADLRRKSFDDLHKLWFVLYKERNLLLSERERIRRNQRPITPKEENRYIKVKRSMGAIKFVLRERSKIKKAIEAEGGTGLADTKPPTL